MSKNVVTMNGRTQRGTLTTTNPAAKRRARFIADAVNDALRHQHVQAQAPILNGVMTIETLKGWTVRRYHPEAEPEVYTDPVPNGIIEEAEARTMKPSWRNRQRLIKRTEQMEQDAHKAHLRMLRERVQAAAQYERDRFADFIV